MTMRVPTDKDTVALIKAIINQDRRERQRAGYRRCTRKLADRIAAELGMNIHTVRSIKERKRHRHIPAARTSQAETVPSERLEKIRQSRIRSGFIAGPWKLIYPEQAWGRWSYKKRIRRLGRPPADGSKC